MTCYPPSVDQDSEPVWSPDSRQVAFLRIPSSRDELIFGPKRTGQPWSIRVADAATGQGHEVWRADAGRGSVFRDAARLAWEPSPLASVKTWRSPVLLVQGDDDRNVPFISR